MVQGNIANKKTSNRLMTSLMIIYYLLESIILFFVPRSMLKHKDVKNQIVLITGAGSGIGQLMALKFLKLGARVVIWDVNEKGMDVTKEMAKEEKLNMNNLFAYKIDITDSNAIYETAKRVQNEIGTVDILLNNAGVVSGRNFLDIPDDRITLTFKVNSLSHFFMIKAFLPEMIKRNKGHIVTVASVAGNIGVCSLTDYCASKYANVGLDYALRLELSKANLDNIKTTIIKPYFITTGMFSGVDPGVFAYLQPEYVAEKAIEGILTESTEVVLPGYLNWLLPLIPLLPSKCFVPIMDFVGGYEFMNNFHGRQPIVNKESEINNNSNIINNNNIKQ